MCPYTWKYVDKDGNWRTDKMINVENGSTSSYVGKDGNWNSDNMLPLPTYLTPGWGMPE